MNPSIKPYVAFSQDTQLLTKNQDKKESESLGKEVSGLTQEKKLGQVQESAYTVSKKQLNAAIIESSLKFNKTIGEQPQALILKTALQGINEALKELGIETSVEDAYESGVDFTPEATAERIVAFSTQFLASYREQHPEMKEEESLNAFMGIINQGIEQGFGEAKDILGSLKVLTGDVADNIDKTYNLVQEKLQSFVNMLNKKDDDEPSSTL